MPQHPSPDQVLYYEGTTFVVEWYYTENGEIPALAYYQSMTESEQERLDFLVMRLADSPIGTRLPNTMYRGEDSVNKIYGFKPAAQRFFNFTTHDRKIIITNAMRKHSQKMTKQDRKKIEVAIAYRADYLQRVERGTYYD